MKMLTFELSKELMFYILHLCKSESLTIESELVMIRKIFYQTLMYNAHKATPSGNPVSGPPPTSVFYICLILAIIGIVHTIL